MKKNTKLLLAVGGCLVVSIAAAMIIVSYLVDVEGLKIRIGEEISKVAGRSVSVEGEVDLSLFPVAKIYSDGISVSSRPGFEEKKQLTVESFQARVKFLPLLKNDIQIKSLVLVRPRLVFEKDENGRLNWQVEKNAVGSVESDQANAGADNKKKKNDTAAATLNIRRLTVENGTVLLIDRSTGKRNEIGGIGFAMEQITAEHPISLNLNATFKGLPFSLDGSVGPLVSKMDKGGTPFDLRLNSSKQISLAAKGAFAYFSENPFLDMTVKLDSFSPRKFASAFGLGNVFDTADSSVFDKVEFSADIKASPALATVENARLMFDDSTVMLNAKATEFSKPILFFDVKADVIDLDKYSAAEKKASKSEIGFNKDRIVDYFSGKPVLSGHIAIGRFKGNGIELENVELKMNGQRGQFFVNPLRMDLFGGNLELNGNVKIDDKIPKSRIKAAARNIDADELMITLQKFGIVERGMLAGAASLEANFTTMGEDLDAIKKSMKGTAELILRNGAIKGLDIDSLLRNAETWNSGMMSDAQETSFTELKSYLRFEKGVVRTANARATIVSPTLRVSISGAANLFAETLDFRIEPLMMETATELTNGEEPYGAPVPVLVSGTFEEPEFENDTAKPTENAGGSEMLRDLRSTKKPEPRAENEAPTKKGKSVQTPDMKDSGDDRKNLESFQDLFQSSPAKK